jgi:predicted nucleotidyltransferase component of viral defense system
MHVLTPLQSKVLAAIGRSRLNDSFFLTGGTALAELYLRHRYSVDLDLFTSDDAAVARVAPQLQEIARELGLRLSFTRTLDTFLECFLEAPDGERIEMDFAQDSPYRLEPTRLDESLGVHVDNLVDIACNKLSALFDRAEPKDFVDVYFVCREAMPFDRLLELTRKKHVGIDDYWLAAALRQAAEVEILPRMIKPLSVSELTEFFLGRAKAVMDRIA